MNEYKERFRDFVLNGVKGYYVEHGYSVDPSKTGWPAMGHEDSLVYFDQQFPRFQAMIELLQQNKVVPLCSCELGSFYPYVSLYFCGEIDLFDIAPIKFPEAAKPYDVEGVRLSSKNFCTDPLPHKEYDLVILSEVMEHMACNLFAFCDQVKQIVRPGGHLLVTYPVEYGNNARDYGYNVGDLNESHDGHLREFTDDTVRLFFRDLTKVAQTEVTYPAYGRVIIVLYRREL